MSVSVIRVRTRDTRHGHDLRFGAHHCPFFNLLQGFFRSIFSILFSLISKEDGFVKSAKTVTPANAGVHK
jgi:hypothetical protein